MEVYRLISEEMGVGFSNRQLVRVHSPFRERPPTPASEYEGRKFHPITVKIGRLSRNSPRDCEHIEKIAGGVGVQVGGSGTLDR